MTTDHGRLTADRAPEKAAGIFEDAVEDQSGRSS